MYVREESDREPATEAVMHAAVETVSAGTPLALSTADDGSMALAVPLRVEGRLEMAQRGQLVGGAKQGESVCDGFAKAVTGDQRGRLGSFEQQGATFSGDCGDSPMLVERGSGQSRQFTRREITLGRRAKHKHTAASSGGVDRNYTGAQRRCRKRSYGMRL